MNDYSRVTYAGGWQMPKASDVRVIHPDGTEEIKPRNDFIKRSRAGRELRRKAATFRTKPARAYTIRPKRKARVWK
jgi:hypothetical protein